MSSKSEKRTSIGGQAVIEGVMMRGPSSMATAVRDEQNNIRVESKRIKPMSSRKKILRFPIIRGCVAFIDSLVGGTKTLMRSAEVFGEGEPSKAEKWLSEKLKINVMSVVITLSTLLGVAIAVALFIIAPIFIRKLIEFLITKDSIYLSLSYKISILNVWAKNFIEGGIKLLIFILYILIVSLIKDVRRVFMYHGAEHKTISCFEHGLDLTIENARTCSRVHDRCGTTFLVFVMVISIILFACFEGVFGNGIEGFLRILIKIAFLPIVAGLSYELLKGLAKTQSPIFFPLKVPGLLLQRLTTKEPDDSMLEVAITSFKTVLSLESDPNYPTSSFDQFITLKDATQEVKKTLSCVGIEEDAEAEWIVSIVANVNRSEAYSDKFISLEIYNKIRHILAQRIKGMPLWYCIGDTEFFGCKIKVDERVLIPRPETENLVEESLKVIDSTKTCLDLCCGSGAIAIAINKKTNAKTFASDISGDCLDLAKENAKINNVDITFIKSDMFKNISQKFDVIVSNPPYIKTQDISSLQTEIKDFEPKIALDGGNDGLDFYRIIAFNCKNYLNNNGCLFLEVGFDQAKVVASLFSDYISLEIIKDLEGVDRIIKVVY